MRDDAFDRKDEELEALLDAALMNYAQAEREDEAVAGVASRTLTAVRAKAASGIASRTKPRRGSVWMFCALPIAAALVMAVVLPLRHRASPTTAVQVAHGGDMISHGTSPAMAGGKSLQAHENVPHVSQSMTAMHASVHVQRKAPAAELLPKREVFPTPTPLSPEEQTLMAMVRRDPRQAQQAMSMPEQKPIEPLEIKPVMIAAIEVAPLNPPDKGKN
ncbi:hypothetical protein [Silvibacterium sp.]|uniref:hypothetical protein n=1 Tax=Silvibacterium sp. TaxID=1964179 RepID=UPI0039E6FC1F